MFLNSFFVLHHAQTDSLVNDNKIMQNHGAIAQTGQYDFDKCGSYSPFLPSIVNDLQPWQHM